MIGGIEMDLKHDGQLGLAIAIKTAQIQRTTLRSITEDHVRACLLGYTWFGHKPKTLNEAVNDILNLNVNEVIAYLSNQAMNLGGQIDMEELDELVEKELS